MVYRHFIGTSEHPIDRPQAVQRLSTPSHRGCKTVAEVAVAKGPICPGHCLVIPVRHIPRSIDAPERDQMKIYIEAVRKA